MLSRLTFVLITAFFLTMNYLLWRSEFGGRNTTESSVPAEKVWEKVLTAPDNSSLNIIYHGKKIGYCNWAANVTENRVNNSANPDDFEPEGMVKSPANYELELEGNVAIPSLTNSARFNLSLVLSTNREWQDVLLHVSVRPDTWELRASAASQKLQLITEDDTGRTEQTYKFSDLQNPDFLANEFGGPMGFLLLAGLGPNLRTNSLASASLGLKWEAHNHFMQFGHSKVRVYKLETTILDRYKIYMFVSRVGEVLWIHFPDDLVLSNDAFTHF